MLLSYRHNAGPQSCCKYIATSLHLSYMAAMGLHDSNIPTSQQHDCMPAICLHASNVPTCQQCAYISAYGCGPATWLRVSNLPTSQQYGYIPAKYLYFSNMTVCLRTNLYLYNILVFPPSNLGGGKTGVQLASKVRLFCKRL